MLGFLSVAAHHGEAGDPDLLEWIMHRLDSLIGLDPAVIVIILTAVIVLIPVGSWLCTRCIAVRRQRKRISQAHLHLLHRYSLATGRSSPTRSVRRW